MGRHRDDPAILAARESVKRLDVGRAALRAMTREERLTIYVELEREFKLKGSSAPSASIKAGAKFEEPEPEPEPGRRHCRNCGGVGHNSRSCKQPKRKQTSEAKAPNKHATKYPSYAYLAEKFIQENPHGVRAMEVSQASREHPIGLNQETGRTRDQYGARSTGPVRLHTTRACGWSTMLPSVAVRGHRSKKHGNATGWCPWNAMKTTTIMPQPRMHHRSTATSLRLSATESVEGNLPCVIHYQVGADG